MYFGTFNVINATQNKMLNTDDVKTETELNH